MNQAAVARFEPNAAAALVDKRALVGNSPDGSGHPDRYVCKRCNFQLVPTNCSGVGVRVSAGLKA